VRGKKVVTETVQTTGPAVKAVFTEETIGNITIVNVELQDEKGRFVPDACQDVTLSIDCGRIIGAGNGDPAYLEPDRALTIPTFNGRAQFIIEGHPGNITVSL